MTAVEVVFWLCAGLIVYTHAGYPLALLLLIRTTPRRAEDVPMADEIGPSAGDAGELPRVSLLIPAYDEEEVIAAKVADALALDYPRELLQVIVASDGSTDATVERARAAGADLVLDLPRRRQGRRPQRRRRASPTESCSPSPTPTAPGRPTRCGG